MSSEHLMYIQFMSCVQGDGPAVAFFFSKVGDLDQQFHNKRAASQMHSCEFSVTFQNNCFIEHLPKTTFERACYLPTLIQFFYFHSKLCFYC